MRISPDSSCVSSATACAFLFVLLNYVHGRRALSVLLCLQSVHPHSFAICHKNMHLKFESVKAIFFYNNVISIDLFFTIDKDVNI